MALCGHARAQGIIVNDPASILEEVQQLTQQVKSYALQAQQFMTEVQQLEAFVHNPNLGAALGLMNTTGLSNDLPVNPAAIQSLTNGYSSLTSLAGILGKLTTLTNLVNTNYNTNHIYSPTDGSWNSQQLIAAGNAIAGVQGAAQSAYQDLRTHLPIIQSLRNQLLTATNPKDVADAQSELVAEAAWTNNLQSELAAIQVNAQQQAASRAQQANESLDAGIDSFLQQANAAGEGLTQ